MPEVEAAITRRSHWLLNHPAELAWEADLAARLAGAVRELEQPATGHDHAEPDHDLQGLLLRSIDLRTIDLSRHLPRTGIDRATSDALGLPHRRDGADVALPPPGRGLDAGPDLGL